MELFLSIILFILSKMSLLNSSGVMSKDVSLNLLFLLDPPWNQFMETVRSQGLALALMHSSAAKASFFNTLTGWNFCSHAFIEDWRPVQGVPRLSPDDCWDRLQPPARARYPTDGLDGIENGWMLSLNSLLWKVLHIIYNDGITSCFIKMLVVIYRI